MKFNVGEKYFNSKKECTEYTRSLIKTLGECNIDVSHPNYDYFYNLIKYHPEYELKIGCGVDLFIIQNNLMNKTSYTTYIKRLDNTIIDFSWIVCCNQQKTKSRQENLIRAMREAISPQIINYLKQNNKNIKCNICGITGSDYHVDHVIPFSMIKNNFLKQNKENIPEIYDNIYHVASLQDSKFKNDWCHYHKDNASYQILCKKCNLKKSNNI